MKTLSFVAVGEALSSLWYPGSCLCLLPSAHFHAFILPSCFSVRKIREERASACWCLDSDLASTGMYVSMSWSCLSSFVMAAVPLSPKHLSLALRLNCCTMMLPMMCSCISSSVIGLSLKLLVLVWKILSVWSYCLFFPFAI